MSWFLSLDSLDIYLSQASTKGTVTQNLEEKMMPKGHNKPIDGRVFHAKVGPKWLGYIAKYYEKHQSFLG